MVRYTTQGESTMSNKKIAITWADKTTKKATGFVYSDRFFEPFTNPQTRSKIVNELLNRNVIVWSDTQEGAFLFKKGDARLKVVSDGNIKIGSWTENDNIMILPALSIN